MSIRHNTLTNRSPDAHVVPDAGDRARERTGLAERVTAILGGPTSLRDSQFIVHENGLGSAYFFSRSAPNAPPRGHTRRTQVALPLLGAFGWQLGRRQELVDGNTTLFTTEGQEFGESHPIHGVGHACTIVLPTDAALEELSGMKSALSADPFNDVVRRASPRAQLLAYRLAVLTPEQSRTLGDELVAQFLVELFPCEIETRPRLSRPIARKAKEYLYGLNGDRLSLDAAALELGVTPIYLTQAFKAAEGIPLYRYYLNARLAEALGRLAHADSITELALELGFSSHSHFSAAFLARYGITPSDYRDEVRTGRPVPRSSNQAALQQLSTVVRLLT